MTSLELIERTIFTFLFMTRHRLFTRTAFAVGLGIIFSSSALFFGNGAPVGKTGSPGDMNNTCTDCHGGGLSVTDQTISIDVDLGMDTEIIAGHTYDITVTANGPSHTKIGFESTIEKDTDNAKTGTFETMDANAQIKDSFYVTHVGTGTAATGGEASWTYSWTAPADYIGDATIYVASIFSNNNGENTGDVTMTASEQISITENLSVVELANDMKLSLSPNPTTEFVNLDFVLTESSQIKIQLIDINGKYSQILSEKNMDAGEHHISANLDVPAGNYLISVQKGAEIFVDKLVVQ